MVSKPETTIWNSDEKRDGTYFESVIKIQNVQLINTKHSNSLVYG